MPGTWRIGDALRAARVRLAAAGVEGPARDARLLLQAATGFSAAEVLAHPDWRLDAAAEAAFSASVTRRAGREPVARIVGRQAFRDFELDLNAASLVPRPETETLVETALRLVRDRPPGIAIGDWGTGPGTVLLALLRALPEARGLGLDISGEAIEAARENARRLGLEDRATFRVGDYRSWAGDRVDLLVSNPPYIPSAEVDGLQPEVARFDPRLALDGGADGLDHYRVLAAGAGRWLAEDGVAAVEVGTGQAADVASIFAGEGLALLAVDRDLSGIERVVAARRERHSPKKTLGNPCGGG